MKKAKAATPRERIDNAMDVVNHYACIDGAHHKQWVIDQVVRALLGDGYDAWAEGDGDGGWDEGVAP